MCKADIHAYRVSSLLVRTAKITRSNAIHKSYNMFVNIDTARTVFNKLAFSTQDIMLKIGIDLASSKEYQYKDVIRYFVLYYLNKAEEIDIRDLDYMKLRRNFIAVHNTFKKDFHIDYTKSILKDLENKKYTLRDIGELNNTTSILYDVYKKGYPISTCVYFVQAYNDYDNMCMVDESKDHFIFRKTLKLLLEVSSI
jgi:hypothetical protein